MSAPSPSRESGPLWVALAVTVAVGGFLVGTRPAIVPSAEPAGEPVAGSLGNIPPAPSYGELQSRQVGPNADWRSNLESLAAGLPDPLDPVAVNRDAWDTTVGALLENRAYDGAPPTIPHPIRAEGGLECMACHREGLVVDGRVARPPSHAEYTNCTQCHIRSDAMIGNDRPSEGTLEHVEELGGTNRFGGHMWPAHGDRAWDGAPPTIPHPTWMRQNCASCHGTTGRYGLRSSHPDRQNCLQCHVPSDGLAPTVPPLRP